MEDPPRIDRVVSVRDVSPVDAASLMKSFLLHIDRYHGHRRSRRNDVDDNWDGREIDGDPPPSLSFLLDEAVPTDETGYATTTTTTTTKEITTSANANANNNDNNYGAMAVRKTWQEREEEALIEQMDRLAEASALNDHSAGGFGGVSDDVLERLDTIARSMCAEVEGRSTNAASGGGGVDGDGCHESSTTRDLEEEMGGAMGGREDDDIGDGAFIPAGAVGAVGSVHEEQRRRRKQQERQGQRQQQLPWEEDAAVGVTNKDKKKEKKAKKAAKKARKDAKRKAKEMNGGREGNDSKRTKLDV